MTKFDSAKYTATLLLGMCLLLVSNMSFAALTAVVDRNQIASGEGLTLTLRYEGTADTDSLNFSGLQQDFQIISVSPQTSVTIINGRQTSSTAWRIALIPRREGNLVIPSFRVGGDVSDAITIQVTDAASSGQAAPMTVDVTVSSTDIYVQQELLVTVKLTTRNDVSGISGESLRLENADITLIDQQQSQEISGGLESTINTWVYAVYPTEAGTLAIPGQIFTAIQGRTSLYSLSNNGRRIHARSQPELINVRPIPDGDAGRWFPAHQVSLNAQWQGDVTQTRVGEPITREIRIQALGQRASAIFPTPELSLEGLRVYPEQPELSDINTSSGILGERIESAAIVPRTAGTLVLPEIRVPWWNTQTQQWEDAILPAETIQVAPAQGNVSTTDLSNESLTATTTSTADPSSDGLNPAFQWNLYTYALAGVLALLLLDNIRLRWRSRPASLGPSPEQKPAMPSEKQAWRDLSSAIKNQDPRSVHQQTLRWAQVRWPNKSIRALAQVADIYNDSALDEQLNILQSCLYGHGVDSVSDVRFKGETLKRRLETLRFHDKTAPQESSLSALYVSGTVN